MCNLSWTPHSSLEKDNSVNHSCVSPNMGCLEITKGHRGCWQIFMVAPLLLTHQSSKTMFVCLFVSILFLLSLEQYNEWAHALLVEILTKV